MTNMILRAKQAGLEPTECPIQWKGTSEQMQRYLGARGFALSEDGCYWQSTRYPFVTLYAFREFAPSGKSTLRRRLREAKELLERALPLVERYCEELRDQDMGVDIRAWLADREADHA